MGDLIIRKCSIAEAEQQPNLVDIIGEYAKELVVEGAPPAAAKMELYHQLEKSGVLQGFGAFFQDVMIGFVTVLVTVLPHWGVTMAVTESYFVLKEFRHTGAGLKLRIVAENYAREKGSPCLLISAPKGGVLADVLEASKDYVETNRVFFKSLKQEGDLHA